MRWGILEAAVVCTLSGSAMAQTATIAERQVWTIRNSPTDSVRLVIQKIEPWAGGGEVVHVSLYGLIFPDGFEGVVSHMPFARDALEASLDVRQSETPRPGVVIDTGYGIWKSEQGGIYTISVAQALAVMFRSMINAPLPEEA